MVLCGKEFSETLLEQISSRIGSAPRLTRVQLSREVCGWLNWVSPNGKLSSSIAEAASARAHSIAASGRNDSAGEATGMGGLFRTARTSALQIEGAW